MANVKISALPVASNVASTDTFPFVQGAVTKQVTRDVLMELVSAGAGTASLPSYTFAGDAGTGMWSPAANTLAWSVNGSESMRLDSSGNLGIGTSSPVANLHVNTTVGNTVVHLTGALGATASNGLDLIVGAGGDASIWQRENNYLRFGTNNTERMRLDPSGNLGIGKTPAAKLDVLGTVGQIQSGAIGTNVIWDVGTSAARVRMAAAAAANDFLTSSAQSDGLIYSPADRLLVGTAAPKDTLFYTNDTERARITSGGDLLVGTTSVLGTTRFNVVNSGGPAIYASGSTAGARFDSPLNGTETVQVVNTDTTGNNLLVSFYTDSAPTFRGAITYNRGTGLISYGTSSDYRAKDIIGPVQNPGATIDALKVYEGKMKGATQSRPMLIAHEAQEHVPYAVSGVKDEMNEDGVPRFQQMDVSSLVPLLVAEIQFLRARVAALELR